MPEDEDFRRPINIELIEKDNKEYVAVTWKKPTDYDHLKSYEVNDHLVFAGCSNDNTKVEDGQMKCDRKDLYVVLHPVREWLKDHVIER